MRRFPFSFKNLFFPNLKENFFKLSHSHLRLYTKKPETISDMNIKKLMDTPMTWQKKLDTKELSYITNDNRFQIKLRDFSDESLYQLIIEDRQNKQVV